MSFDVKDWRNANTYAGGGDTSTPLSAVALEDMETRLSEYTDSVVGGGIELGYAQITTTYSTAGTAIADITGLTTTVTTDVRPIVIKFQADGMSCGAALGGGVYLQEDGVEIGAIAAVSGNVFAPAHGERRRNPTPGSHTYLLRSKQLGAGTITVIAGAGTAATTNGPAFIQVLEV